MRGMSLKKIILVMPSLILCDGGAIMDQKERLIELITNTPRLICKGGRAQGKTYQTASNMADHLLANGVIVPPCAIGTHLWKVTHPYRQEPKVTEFVVKNFRTAGKKHQLQIEVQAVNVPVTNWMRFEAFHTTKEEAEADMAERKSQ